LNPRVAWGATGILSSTPVLLLRPLLLYLFSVVTLHISWILRAYFASFGCFKLINKPPSSTVGTIIVIGPDAYEGLSAMRHFPFEVL